MTNETGDLTSARSERSGSERITMAIDRANRMGRPAIAAFLTAGFPSRGDFAGLLESAVSEADLVEVGVPFSDPMADGLTIQRSSRTALEDGTTLPWILETVAALAGTGSPVLLMSYLNPIMAHGFNRFAADAAKTDVAGLIVPDLPLEESDDLRSALDPRGIALVQLVTPATPADRLERVCRASRGFVYAVTMTGVTGGEILPAVLRDYLDRILYRITMAGALFLGIIAIMQYYIGDITGVTTFTLVGGTSLLIVVGVALDTMQQIEAQLLMRHYKGFLA